ncbi:hypothetical protein EFA69_16225 [Rufibacter immobilis]|uniref:Uncharacterized protein n=1 Tax=Rufibacter immobilis TaxID=1348778 RepID=A0A3M9MQ57_9BACT|nr:hypothetical protein [Rufibacter immobilis]RNI27664.1 hypothetical protein EFA69_16225 [Rufibacter immobilis]
MIAFILLLLFLLDLIKFRTAVIIYLLMIVLSSCTPAYYRDIEQRQFLFNTGRTRWHVEPATSNQAKFRRDKFPLLRK